MATTHSSQLVEVTPAAAEKLEKVLEDEGENGSLLRIMVVPGNNGGVQYMLGVEKEAKDNDFIVDTDTIQVLIDAESAPLIEGAQIDYVEDLMRSGFVISNPNVHGSGGCGGGGGGCGCGGGGGGGCGDSGGGGGGCGCGDGDSSGGGGGGGGCGCGGGGCGGH